MNENLEKLLKLQAEIQEIEDLAKDFRSKSLHNKAKAKEFKKLSRWLRELEEVKMERMLEFKEENSL